MRTAPLLALALTTLAGLAGAAEVYRWTDAEGRVHFSDSPPPGVPDAELLAIRSKPTDPAQLEQDALAQDLRAKQSAMEDQLRADQAKRAGEEAAAKQQACDAARKRYAGVMDSRKFVTTAADGSETWMSGADADRMKSELKAKADEACAGLD